MSIVSIILLLACVFSFGLLALRSLRVLFLELSGRNGPADRTTMLVALGMLLLSLAVLGVAARWVASMPS